MSSVNLTLAQRDLVEALQSGALLTFAHSDWRVYVLRAPDGRVRPVRYATARALVRLGLLDKATRELVGDSVLNVHRLRAQFRRPAR